MVLDGKVAVVTGAASGIGLAMTEQFVGSGAKVVTNSYHGAYWAMLLGRKVVLAAPYSSKFHHYRHPPEISEDRSWTPALSCHGKDDRGALQECRDANRKFLKLALDRMTTQSSGVNSVRNL